MDDFDPHSIAARTMRGDLRDAMMNQIIGMPDHYHKLPEKKQREIANQLDTYARDMTEKLIKLVRAEGVDTVSATIEDFKVKGGTVEIKLKGSVSDQVLLTLLHARKEQVILTPASSRPYEGQSTTPEDFVQPDQPGLPATEPAPEPKTQIEEPPEDPTPESETAPAEAAAEPEQPAETVEPESQAKAEAAPAAAPSGAETESQDSMPANDLDARPKPLFPVEGAQLKSYGANSDIYWAGVISYNKEGALDDNPHKGTTREGKIWKLGWQQAARFFTENNTIAVIPDEFDPAMRAEPRPEPEEPTPSPEPFREDREGEVRDTGAQSGSGPVDANADPGGDMPAFLDRRQGQPVETTTAPPPPQRDADDELTDAL